MSLLDRIREREEQRKKEQALREGKTYIPPTWPDGFPRLLDIKPKPKEGFIEERIIFRSIKDKKENQYRNASFYVSQNEIYFLLDTKGSIQEWNVMSFNDYSQEYLRIYEHIKSTGKLTGRNKFAELILFDEIITTVPINLIMSLKPSPPQIDQTQAAYGDYLESKYLDARQDEFDLPEDIDPIK